MTLMLFLIAVIAGVGLSHLIVDGSIFSKWRGKLITKYKDTKPWVLELITCYQCSGFWSGALMGLILQPISWDLFSHLWWIVALVFSIPLYLIITPLIVGFAVSYASMVGAAFLNWLDAPAIAAVKKKNENN